MFSGITFTCFAASYSVALLLEISRLFFRMSVRLVVLLAFVFAGLVAQTLFLIQRATAPDIAGLPLSTWCDWYLIAAWVLVAIYLGLAIARPLMAVGIFMLPMVLALVGVAFSVKDAEAFPRSQALQAWGLAHGIMLLLGTIVVSFGFVAGVTFLVQAWRLKHMLPPRQGFKLPSLEWLQRVNKQALIVSAFCIALGLVAGVVLNIIKSAGQPGTVPWSDPVVVTSGLLLAWLVAASIFELTYKPAQQGRKVAYLTVASFVFLAVVIALLVLGDTQHTPTQQKPTQRSEISSARTFVGASLGEAAR
jgi:hypothetical protein